MSSMHRQDYAALWARVREWAKANPVIATAIATAIVTAAVVIGLKL